MTGIPSEVFVVPFVQGTDTKQSPKNPTAGRLLQAVDVDFSSPGELTQRTGFTRLTNQLAPGGGRIRSGQHLQSYGNELILFDGTSAHSYDPASEFWVNKGYVPTLNISDKTIANSNTSQTDVVSATLRGITLFAWHEGEALYCCSINEQTGGTLLPKTLVTAGGTHPRVLAMSDRLLIFYCSGLDLKYREYFLEDITTLQPEATSMGEVSNYLLAFMDAIEVNSGSFAVCFNLLISGSTPDGQAGFGWAILDEANDFKGPYQMRTTASCYATCVDGAGVQWVLADGDSPGYLMAQAWDGTTRLQNQFVTPITSSIVAALFENDASAHQVTALFNHQTGTLAYDQTVLYQTKFHADFTGGTVTVDVEPVEILRGVSLASKVFVQSGLDYVQLLQTTELQSTYFTYNLNNNQVVSRDRIGFAGQPAHVLPNPFQFTDGSWSVACSEQNELVSSGSALVSKTGAGCVYLNFGPVVSSVELDKTLLLAGGCPQVYDGVAFVEQNFNYFPEAVTATEVILPFIDPGTREYTGCYAFRDAQGKVSRSATATPIQVINSVSSSYVITVPTLRLTKKLDVWIEVYRTIDLGATFYLITDPVNTLANDPTVDTVTFTDDRADGDITDNNRILYTSIGSLDNKPLPGCEVVRTFNNRFFAGNLSYDQSSVEFSDVSLVGQSVATEFHDEFTLQVDTTGGGITGLQQIDTSLVIYKDRLSYLTNGDGPTPNGGGQQFSTPQLIATDTGCRDPNSIALYPGGAIFKSDKGIYNLDRGGNPSYVGSQVDDFNDLTITGAVLVSDKNQVRFTTSPTGSVGLMYDYLVNQWSTYTNHDAVSCCNWLQPDGRGLFAMLKSNGYVWVEDSTINTDPSGIAGAAEEYDFTVETGWMQPSGQHGWFRARAIDMLGEYTGPHQLQVSIFYNFNHNPSQIKTIPATAIFTQTTTGQEYVPNMWGDSVVWGGISGSLSSSNSGSQPFGFDSNFGVGSNLFGLGGTTVGVPTGSLGDVWGGLWAPYELRVKCNNQKCDSVKVKIEKIHDDDLTGSIGASLTLNSVALEFAPLGGTSRKGRSRTF